MSSTSTYTAPPPDIRAGRRTFIVTVVTTYAATFAFPQRPFTLPEIIGLVIAGGLYLLVGIYAAEWYDRTGSPLALVTFYALEIPLASLIVHWTAGFFLAGLIILPLAGLSVQVLPRRWMLIVCALLVAALAVSYGLHGGWEAALLAGVGYLTAIVFVVVITQMAVRERGIRAEMEQLAADLAVANRRLREYAIQAEELAVTRERARLANEIHDSVGHTLTALDVQLELLVRLPPDQTDQRRQIAQQARTLVKQGLTDMRRAVEALRPAALETFSLREAIAALVADFEQTTRIPVGWKVEGETAPLPPRLALPLYRAAQEALTNVRRHAPSAEQVTVKLSYASEGMRLLVENDIPLTADSLPADSSTEEGYGLRGLRERTEALGGTFSAGADGASTFRLDVSLPLV